MAWPDPSGHGDPPHPPSRSPRRGDDDDRRSNGDDAAERGATQQWHRMTGVGFEFIAAILMLGGLGWYLDTRWGTSPWLLIVGGGLGFALGLLLLVRAARQSFHD